jgi:hypothetical protein
VTKEDFQGDTLPFSSMFNGRGLLVSLCRKWGSPTSAQLILLVTKFNLRES